MSITGWSVLVNEVLQCHLLVVLCMLRGEVSSFVSGEKKAHKQASRSEEPVLNWLVWIFFPL